MPSSAKSSHSSSSSSSKKLESDSSLDSSEGRDKGPVGALPATSKPQTAQPNKLHRGYTNLPKGNKRTSKVFEHLFSQMNLAYAAPTSGKALEEMKMAQMLNAIKGKTVQRQFVKGAQGNFLTKKSGADEAKKQVRKSNDKDKEEQQRQADPRFLSNLRTALQQRFYKMQEKMKNEQKASPSPSQPSVTANQHRHRGSASLNALNRKATIAIDKKRFNQHKALVQSMRASPQRQPNTISNENATRNDTERLKQNLSSSATFQKATQEKSSSASLIASQLFKRTATRGVNRDLIAGSANVQNERQDNDKRQYETVGFKPSAWATQPSRTSHLDQSLSPRPISAKINRALPAVATSGESIDLQLQSLNHQKLNELVSHLNLGGRQQLHSSHKSIFSPISMQSLPTHAEEAQTSQKAIPTQTSITESPIKKRKVSAQPRMRQTSSKRQKPKEDAIVRVQIDSKIYKERSLASRVVAIVERGYELLCRGFTPEQPQSGIKTRILSKSVTQTPELLSLELKKEHWVAVVDLRKGDGPSAQGWMLRKNVIAVNQLQTLSSSTSRKRLTMTLNQSSQNFLHAKPTTDATLNRSLPIKKVKPANPQAQHHRVLRSRQIVAARIVSEPSDSSQLLNVEADKSRLFSRYDEQRKLRELKMVDLDSEYISGPIRREIVPEHKIVTFKDHVYQAMRQIRESKLSRP